MRRIETRAEWDFVRAAGRGCILNSYGDALGLPGFLGNMLHATDCPKLLHVRGWGTAYFAAAPTYFADDCAAAVAWLEREHGAEGTAWRPCGHCVREGRLPAGSR